MKLTASDIFHTFELIVTSIEAIQTRKIFNFAKCFASEKYLSVIIFSYLQDNSLKWFTLFRHDTLLHLTFSVWTMKKAKREKRMSHLGIFAVFIINVGALTVWVEILVKYFKGEMLPGLLILIRISSHFWPCIMKPKKVIFIFTTRTVAIKPQAA